MFFDYLLYQLVLVTIISPAGVTKGWSVVLLNIVKVNAAGVKYLVDTLVELLYIPVVANNMVALFDKLFSRHNHKIWLMEIPTRGSED